MVAVAETKPHAVYCERDWSRSCVAENYRAAFFVWRGWQHKDPQGLADYQYHFRIRCLGRECDPGTPVIDVNE